MVGPFSSSSRKILSAAVLIAVCYLAADLTAARLERRLRPPLRPLQSGLSIPEPGTLDARGLETLLHVAVPPPAPPPRSEPARSTSVVPPSLTSRAGPPPLLTGTMAGAGRSLAVLQRAEETRVLSVGEEWDGYRLLEADRSSATLQDRDGNRLILELGRKAPLPPVAAPSPAAPHVWGRQEMTAALTRLEQNPGQLMIHLTPEGLQVTFPDRENVLAQVGLESGDVIAALNGRPLTTRDDLEWAVNELRNAEELRFDLVRQGQSLHRDVPLSKP